MCVAALAVEEWSAKLVFELLYCAGEGGLTNVALLGRTGEVQRSREGYEVPDLLHFHDGPPRA